MENKLHVYHISRTDLGDACELKPKIPIFRAYGEDEEVPRICVCTSIPCCMYAINGLPYLRNLDGMYLNLYLYEAYVDINDIVQPSNKQVYDAWAWGELWVTRPYIFTKVNDYIFDKQMEIPGSGYSRYCMTALNHDEVVDRHYDNIVYGDIDSFSIVMLDPDRIEEAQEFHKYIEEDENAKRFFNSVRKQN